MLNVLSTVVEIAAGVAAGPGLTTPKLPNTGTDADGNGINAVAIAVVAGSLAVVLLPPTCSTRTTRLAAV